MFISDFAIRRPIVTIVTMLALVVFGLVALLRLDTDEFPDIAAPIVFVGFFYPGASPEQVEREVVDRIEDRFSGISGVDKINSTAVDGAARVVVTFDFDKPVDQATQDVRDAISAVRGQLPQELLEPVIQRFDPADQPIVSLALTSASLTAGAADPDRRPDDRRRPALDPGRGAGEHRRRRLGHPQRRARSDCAGAAGVGVDQVVAALRAQNLAAPVGQVTGPITERAIRLRDASRAPRTSAS
jgi:HAE1 family hydrophobic/amphiphilic exporter-1